MGDWIRRGRNTRLVVGSSAYAKYMAPAEDHRVLQNGLIAVGCLRLFMVWLVLGR